MSLIYRREKQRSVLISCSWCFPLHFLHILEPVQGEAHCLFSFLFFFYSIHTFIQVKHRDSTGPKRPELLQGSTGSEVTKIHSAWVKWWFHRSVLLQIKGDLLRSPPGLDSRLVSQLTVREAIVYDVKVTAALYLWGFPAGWCPSRRGRQSGCFLCLPQWWSDGKAVSLGFSSYD